MKTLAVRFEGTISTVKPGDVALLDFGTPVPEVVEFLRLVKDDFYITVVSGLANGYSGLRMLIAWLNEHDVPYSDVWDQFGFPEAEVVIDNLARRCVGDPKKLAKALKEIV